jgi:hypothetical protein
MRLSGLSLAAILLFSSVMLAQHSSGGGGGGGSSGGGGGGGSHGGSSGGSASSGGGHSSGGSGSHSSGGHSAGSTSSHSGVHGSPSHGSHSILGTNRGVNAKTGPPEKRSFFSFLRHPFRKPEPKTRVVADRRRTICFRGPCPVCLPGHSCGVVPIHRTHNFCSVREIGRGSACLLPTSFFDDCSGPRRMMEQQAQRMQATEAAQTACSATAGQDCSGLTTAAQSEGSLYRTLQDRYRKCQQRSMGAFPFPAFGFSGYSAGLMFGSLEMELDR